MSAIRCIVCFGWGWRPKPRRPFAGTPENCPACEGTGEMVARD